MKLTVPVQVLLFVIACSCAAIPVAAFDFRDQLRLTEQLWYEHWHVKKNKITGYTKIEIKTMVNDGKSFFLEVNRNLNRKKEVFSEKKTLFSSETGDLMSYTEIDYRTDMRINNRVAGDEILTEVRKGEEAMKIALDREDGLVPFEVLTYYLQSSLPRLQQEGHFVFTLYLPVMAIELKGKGLPPSLSKIEMEVTVEKTGTEESPLGKVNTMHLVLKPTSFLINTLLPREKTEFRFTFMTDPPNLLLSFRENKTSSILTSVRF